MTTEQQLAEYEQRIVQLEKALEQAQLEHQEQTDKSVEAIERFRHLLSVLPAGVILLDAAGLVTVANAAALDFLGEPLQGECWISIIERSFAPRVDDGHEVSLKDGRRVSLMTCAMEFELGQLVLLTDQTETRQLQDRLSHYQRLSEMGRMMASLAHQIRTPLSAALLYVDHLTRVDLQLEQRQKFARKAKSRLTNLEQQVRDMLIFARGEMRLDADVSSKDLMAELEEQLDMPLVNYDADCECINLAPDCRLYCNKEALTGVCMNLVENALQACGNGCELILRFTEEQEQLRIDVIDQGPGMDELTLDKIQQPFYTTKSHGTGLGLAVAKVVAQAHGGDFLISSIEGQGTMATLLIPCNKESDR